MTPEERERMNALCLQIQQEKDYAKFEALSHELNDLVARKQRRFPARHSPLTSPSERAWKVMPAVAQQIIRPPPLQIQHLRPARRAAGRNTRGTPTVRHLSILPNEYN